MTNAHSTKFISLTELAAEITGTIRVAFESRSYWVIGEVTSHNFYTTKARHYFDLVEKSARGPEIVAKMQCVAWSEGARSIQDFEQATGQTFKNDLQVLIRVSVDFHPAYGLKLIVQEIDIRFTIGALERQKQITLQRLLEECSPFIRRAGDRYITQNQERPLSAVLQKIAVVTSSQSAGLTDFTHTLESNAFGYTFSVRVFHTSIQGEANAELFYHTLLDVYHTRIAYDAVVIIRGGGAQSDFLIFDQFILGKIVARFPIPVITGIGHQKNETIVDLMAHTATKTPTRAAEFIIAHNRHFEEQLLGAQNALIIRTQQILSKNRTALHAARAQIVNRSRDWIRNRNGLLVHLNQLAVHGAEKFLSRQKRILVQRASIIATEPKITVSNKRSHLNTAIDHLRNFQHQLLKTQTVWLNHQYTVMKAMAPENILKKGFAIVKKKGKIASHAEDIGVGDELSIILSTVEMKTTVTSKTNYDRTEFDL